MALINLAYNTLNDDEKRARYDATGRTGADNRDQAMWNLAYGYLTRAIFAVEDYKKMNMIGIACSFISDDIQKMHGVVRETEAKISIMEDMLKRLKPKEGSNPFLINAMRNDIEDTANHVKNVKRDIELHLKVIDFIESYDYEIDPSESEDGFTSFYTDINLNTIDNG